MADGLVIAGTPLPSRLFAGTGKFGDHAEMRAALEAAGASLVTVALKRVGAEDGGDDLLPALRDGPWRLLPNTSGARDADEAVFAAELGREALGTDWVKLEIHPDPRYLMPDPVETLKAAEALVARGFTVLPYCHADPVLCKRLEEAGTAAVMPLAAPIGSNAGLQAAHFLRIIVEQAGVPVVVDAGIGTPSQAAAAMELGADAVLVNTALAVAGDPPTIGRAFALAVEAGRAAYQAGPAPAREIAAATSPLTGFLDEL